jgi:twitching motility protein PilT
MFNRDEEAQIRLRLAEMLRYIVCQRLVPKIAGGRHLITEIMGTNLRVKEAIVHGENEERTFDAIIESSITFGWETFDHSLGESFRNEMIAEEVASNYSIHKGKISRILDDIKKGRGQDAGADTSELRFALPAKPILPPSLPEKPAGKKIFFKR